MTVKYEGRNRIILSIGYLGDKLLNINSAKRLYKDLGIIISRSDREYRQSLGLEVADEQEGYYCPCCDSVLTYDPD